MQPKILKTMLICYPLIIYLATSVTYILSVIFSPLFSQLQVFFRHLSVLNMVFIFQRDFLHVSAVAIFIYRH